MYCLQICIFFLMLICKSVFSSESNSFVITSTEPTKEHTTNVSEIPEVNPQIYSMEIFTNVSNRFAKTLITSKVKNLKNSPQETTFSVILPENAFISEFEMEIEGKVYTAYVKEKEEARQIYQQAVSSGQSAAHVELSARDSKTFTVSVNIEPESKTIFRLVYEELLQRELGQYELVINIHPGQIVKDLGVQVHINESRPLTFVNTPSLRTGNEISKNDENLDPSAQIDIINRNSATVKFNPDINQQRKFAQNLGGAKENGLAGQFVVQYDVERDPQGGEVLVRDGYFVHFFAPSELKPLPKHVVFVLDHSGSMEGTKFDQVTEAMKNIFSDLHANDLFHMVRFSSDASVWNFETNKFVSTNLSYNVQYGHLEPLLKELNLPVAANASKENLHKAKIVIQNQDDMGATNIIEGLEVGLFLVKKTQEQFPNRYQPIIIFLTDGWPNVGIVSGDEITNLATKLNQGPNRAAIFSLSFGEDADKTFLRKLSSQNLGFSRHIYEAADASLQLHNFYRTVSSPLLNNVTFKYVDGVSSVTKIHYPLLFNGTELVVAGRTTEENLDILLNVTAVCTTGLVNFHTVQSRPVSSLERLWAYLTVKQMLAEKDSVANSTEVTKKALELSLKYSFVTPVSSLVVVKPNETNSVNTENSAPQSNIHEPSYLAPLSTSFRPPQSRRLISPVNAFSAFEDSYDFSIGMNNRFYSSSSFDQDYERQEAPVWATNKTNGLSNYTIPEWLLDLKRNNPNITTTEGTFILGESGDVLSRPDCPKTPLNGTGVCTIIFDCGQIYSYLDDFNVYLKYFCPLNRYAGVCCPTTVN